MHDQIKLKLPYPVKFLGVQFTKKREIGFSFTNLALLLFRDENKITNSKEFKEWVGRHGEAMLSIEMLYYSAVSYTMLKRIKQNFTKDKLRIAIASLDEENQNKLLGCWEKSGTFGATNNKKKATGQSRKAAMSKR